MDRLPARSTDSPIRTTECSGSREPSSTRGPTQDFSLRCLFAPLHGSCVCAKRLHAFCDRVVYGCAPISCYAAPFLMHSAGVRRLDGRHTSRHDESRRMAGRTRRRTSSRADRIPYRRTSLAEIQTTTVPYGNLRCCRAGADEPLAVGIYHAKRPSADGRLLMWKIDSRVLLRHPSGASDPEISRGGVRTGTGRLFRRRGAAPGRSNSWPDVPNQVSTSSCNSVRRPVSSASYCYCR